MSIHKDQLAELRNRQLATLRGDTGAVERITIDCACARDDVEFRVIFARVPPARRFSCEAIERNNGEPSGLRRWQAMTRPKPKARPQSIPAEDIDCSEVRCAGCGHQGQWVRCSGCGSIVCGSRTANARFTCRDSCGASGATSPATAIEAGTSASTPKAIGQSAMMALPRRR